MTSMVKSWKRAKVEEKINKSLFINEENEEENMSDEAADEEVEEDVDSSEEDGDTSEEDVDSSSEESKSETSDGSSDQEIESQPFENLDLVKFQIFGKCGKDLENWVDLARYAGEFGWKSIDEEKLVLFQKSLQKNVDQCYPRIAQFIFKNLDDDVEYLVFFNNAKQLWDVEVRNSPEAELTIEERGNLFKSDLFKKVALRAYDIINTAFSVFYSKVQEKFENGMFIDVDEVKLSSLLFFWDKKYFRDALRNRKYLSEDL